MAYWTFHILTYEDNSNIDHKTNLEQISRCGKELFINACEWSTSEEDMRKYSRDYPRVLFKLVGFGKYYRHIWVKYYRNGMSQESKVTIMCESFNNSKLK